MCFVYENACLFKTLKDFTCKMSLRDTPARDYHRVPPMFGGTFQPGRDIEIPSEAFAVLHSWLKVRAHISYLPGNGSLPANPPPNTTSCSRK